MRILRWRGTPSKRPNRKRALAAGRCWLLLPPRRGECSRSERIDKADELPVHNRKGVGNQRK